MSEANSNKRKQIKDDCPEWAESLIWVIYDAEVSGGNITGDRDWTEGELSKFHDKVFKNSNFSEMTTEQNVDMLFSKICQGLFKEGFEIPQITSFINSRIETGGKMSYCNESEVKEAL